MSKDPYLVLARKWRPQAFESVVGQEHITRTLQNAIANQRIGHAFLFIGSRGIGKTTTARILAKALNCESAEGPTPNPCGECENCRTIAAGSNLDVIEIDGASNNSVEDVRQIRENIRLVPSRSRYKIYVIDEVHQLSPSAFNALLKTLEEPPEHAVFVLATTETHKVPATIISRCQRYDFRRVGMADITKLLRQILDTEGISCSDEALYAIARAADGGIRDSESILEQLISYCGKEITFQDVFDVLGLVDWNVMHRLSLAILEQDIATQLTVIEDVVVAGKDLSQFVQDILHYLRNLLVCKAANPKGLLALPDDDIAAMQDIADRFTLTAIIRLVEQFAELSKGFDSQLAQRIALESLLIRLSKLSVEVSLDVVLEKLAQLGAGGIGASGDPGVPTMTMTRSVGAAGAVMAPKTARETPPDPETSATPEKSRRRITVTQDNMIEHWQHVAEMVSRESLRVGIALAHSRPVAIDGETVVVRFPENQDASMGLVNQPDCRAMIDGVLREFATNLSAWRIDALKEIVESEPPEDRRRAPLSAGQISAEIAEAALENPHVAKVVEVFRGRIVDVKHRADLE
jgi:DNA polymerase-3 subunit gamma/tau